MGGRRDEGENENESERQTSGTQTGFRGGQKAGGPETGVGSARVQDGRLQLYIRRSVRRHTSYLRGSLSKIGHEAHVADARARLLHYLLLKGECDTKSAILSRLSNQAPGARPRTHAAPGHSIQAVTYPGAAAVEGRVQSGASSATAACTTRED